MSCFFFFNDTATTEIYTLSLHDALPIYVQGLPDGRIVERLLRRVVGEISHVQAFLLHDLEVGVGLERRYVGRVRIGDRKSTRLNSSHANISYAVFCLKKKK